MYYREQHRAVRHVDVACLAVDLRRISGGLRGTARRWHAPDASRQAAGAAVSTFSTSSV